MKISKNYHESIRIAEEQKHYDVFHHGTEVEIGAAYASVRLRNGREYPGPYIAAAYDNGTLILVSADHMRLMILNDDVVDDKGSIYTAEAMQPLTAKKPLDALIVGSDDESVRNLRDAYSFKWFYALPEDKARLVVRWWRER